MPIYRWTKQNAVLITKAARYIVPAVIAAMGAVVGVIVNRFTGKKTKRAKGTRQRDGD